MEFRLLRADEIDARVSQVSEKGVGILLYKDARCDMNILDETVGAENWQRSHEIINGNLFCNVGIYIAERNEWVWKQDVGTESYTEKEKGQASDSFKRACFNWGLGRELYTAPFIWMKPDVLKTHKQSENGKWVCFDRFVVTDIAYTGRKISFVKIKNTKNGKTVSFGSETDGIPTDPIDDASQQLITDKEAIILEGMLKQNQKDWVLAQFHLTTLSQLTSAQYAQVMNSLKAKDENGN